MVVSGAGILVWLGALDGGILERVGASVVVERMAGLVKFHYLLFPLPLVLISFSGIFFLVRLYPLL